MDFVNDKIVSGEEDVRRCRLCRAALYYSKHASGSGDGGLQGWLCQRNKAYSGLILSWFIRLKLLEYFTFENLSKTTLRHSQKKLTISVEIALS